MDILINRDLSFSQLDAFFERLLPSTNYLLIYKGTNNWGDARRKEIAFEFIEDEEAESHYKFGLTIMTSFEKPLLVIEVIAASISNHFDCSAICDASRVLLDQSAPLYSLLFEKEAVYLIDDYLSEHANEVTKIVSLSYHQPNEFLSSYL